METQPTVVDMPAQAQSPIKPEQLVQQEVPSSSTVIATPPQLAPGEVQQRKHMHSRNVPLTSGTYIIEITGELGQDHSTSDTIFNSDIVPKNVGNKDSNRNSFLFRQIAYGQGVEDDPNSKWSFVKGDLRRYAAEVQGTFFLVFFHAGIGAANAWFVGRGGPVISPIEFSILYGFIILALIFALGSISGAHFNPIVTMAFAMRGVFTWWRVPIYFVCQFVGAIIGAAIVLAMFGKNEAYVGSNIPPAYSTKYIAFGTEIIGTFMFLMVVFSTARASKIVGASAALAVGAAYTGISILSSYVSTISLNPTRSLATAIIAGSGPQWDVIWAYICGPVIGMLLAVLSDRFIVSQRGADYRIHHATYGTGGKVAAA